MREHERQVSVDPEFRSLYEAEAPAVFRTVYLLCRDRSVAEDATQEAFARALARWARLRQQPWVAGWVTSTALNVARRGLRRRRALPEPEPKEQDVDAAVDLWRAVRALPLRQQQALVLRYRADMSMEEIGAVMECDPGTVRTHLARARETLRARMGAMDARR
jgi:RNA polymerase sigma-70 factor (ECF subfamily)